MGTPVYDVRLDKPQYTRRNPRLQVQLILLGTGNSVCMVNGTRSGHVDSSPCHQDGLPTMAFECADRQTEEEAADHWIGVLADCVHGVRANRVYLVKLGTVVGATGVYVRNHVYWHAPERPGSWHEALSGHAVQQWAHLDLEWQRPALPPQPCDRDCEQLELLCAFAEEKDCVENMWEDRGLGGLFKKRGRGRKRGRSRVDITWVS